MILRPFTMDDVEGMWEVNKDPEVTKYTGDPFHSIEEMEERIARMLSHDYEVHGYGRFALIWKENNELIGFSGLKYESEHFATDLGYRMKKVYWGRCIATESSIASLDFGFNELKLDRIIALAMEENDASIRVMEKVGMTYDGIVVDSISPAIQYSIKMSEFKHP